MKNLLLILLALAAGFAGAMLTPKGDSTYKETAYERVMRTGTLRCGYFLWPTFAERDPNTGVMSGMAVDVANALGHQLNLKIEWAVESPLDQIPETLKSGRVDAICAFDGPWNMGAAKLVNYAKPLAYFQVFAYGRADDNRFSNLEQMNRPEITVSTMDGDISNTLAGQYFPLAKNLGIPGTGDASLTMINVKDNKADLTIMDPLSIATYNANNDKKLKKLLETPLITVATSFTVAGGEQELLNALNQGFDQMWNLGTLDKILDTYDPNGVLFKRPAHGWR